jgi:endogenous inhibitor of DNA gyrase (YacG/DUF329 family)
MADRPTCVYCRQRPAVARWRPFCSERCKMADLGRWLRGDYRIASGPLSPDVDDEPADEETAAPGGQDR